jgi:hypothetical protein
MSRYDVTTYYKDDIFLFLKNLGILMYCNPFYATETKLRTARNCSDPVSCLEPFQGLIASYFRKDYHWSLCTVEETWKHSRGSQQKTERVYFIYNISETTIF